MESADDTHVNGEDNLDAPPAKRRRNFIARNACQACRTKKSRCDEGEPCGLCRSLNIECVYAERRGFKHETSLSVIMAAIKRVEGKIDDMSANNPRTSLGDISTPMPAAPPAVVEQPLVLGNSRQSLSYSARHTLTWTLELDSLHPQDQPLHLEHSQIPLSHEALTSDWFVSVDRTELQLLSQAFFDTFNRTYPILDPDYYFANHLAHVQEHGFDHSIHATLAMAVMALGCMGGLAYVEGGFQPSVKTVELLRSQSNPDGSNEQGLLFFNEARKRIGFHLCEQSLPMSQCYLLFAAYYGQLMRPLDEWAMTYQACQISAAYWSAPRDEHDEYHIDMQRRVFWSALLRETLLIDELQIRRTALQDLETNEIVALPTFLEYKHADSGRRQDAYYHCHFLAQIAIRLIMTRTRDELFNTDPSYALVDELRHQFDQWRTSIPRSIQSDFESDPDTHTEPAQTYVVAMLQSRYHIARYHFGRPFLFKAITKPSSMQQRDLEICSESVEAAMEWWSTLRRCVKMHSYNQVQYFVCGQLFGQLLIVHRLRTSPDPHIRSIVPPGVDEWFREAVDFFNDMAPRNVTIARDARLLSALQTVPG